MDEIERGAATARPRQTGSEFRRSVTVALRAFGRPGPGEDATIERSASRASIEEAVRERLYPKRRGFGSE